MPITIPLTLAVLKLQSNRDVNLNKDLKEE